MVILDPVFGIEDHFILVFPVQLGKVIKQMLFLGCKGEIRQTLLIFLKVDFCIQRRRWFRRFEIDVIIQVDAVFHQVICGQAEKVCKPEQHIGRRHAFATLIITVGGLLDVDGAGYV